MTKRETELLKIAIELESGITLANLQWMGERNDLTLHLKEAIQRFEKWKERYYE